MLPIKFTFCGILITFNDWQFSNAPVAISLIPEGMLAVSSWIQSANALCGILRNCFDKTTFFKLLHL